MMSKAKWFVVSGKEAQYSEIIGTYANQIVPWKFWKILGGTKILYYIHQTPLSSLRFEGWSGFETNVGVGIVKYMHSFEIYIMWSVRTSMHR